MISLYTGGRRGRLALAALSLVGAACSTVGRGSGQPASAIIFTNESLDQAAVYVVAPGVEFRRIGTVIPGRTDTLTVPSDLVARAGTLNIVARLLARNDLPQTGPVTLTAGDRYRVRLGSDARTLSFLPDNP